MYNQNKAQQSKNRVHISWDILYVRSKVLDGFEDHNLPNGFELNPPVCFQHGNKSMFESKCDKLGEIAKRHIFEALVNTAYQRTTFQMHFGFINKLIWPLLNANILMNRI